MAWVQKLARTGLTKGLRGGSRPWLYVGVAATGWRVLSRLATREPEVVAREALAPGETIQIRRLTEEETTVARSRRARRHAARTTRRA